MLLSGYHRERGDKYHQRGQSGAAGVPAGQSGLGKSTMVNTLFKSKVSRKASQPGQEERIPKTVQLQSVTHGKATGAVASLKPRGEAGEASLVHGAP